MYYTDNNDQDPYGNKNEFHQDHYELEDPNQNQNHEDPQRQSLTNQPDLTNNEQTNNNNQYDDYDNLSSANY